MNNRRILSVILLLVLVLSTAGCSGGDTARERALPSLPPLPSAAEAQKAVCEGLTAVNGSVTALGNIDAATAVNDIKALKTQADTWVAAIKAANQVLNRPNISELTTAYDNLSLQITSLPDGAALGAAATTNIRSSVVAVQSALGQARTALNCP